MRRSSTGIIDILAGIRCQERIKRQDPVEDVGLIFEELKRNNCSIDDIQPQCKFRVLELVHILGNISYRLYDIAQMIRPI